MPKNRLRIEQPACYSILVQGWLDERWSGRLGGMAIATALGTSGTPVTCLHGELLDQAALFGVLNALYQLQLPLISVTHLESEDEVR